MNSNVFEMQQWMREFQVDFVKAMKEELGKQIDFVVKKLKEEWELNDKYIIYFLTEILGEHMKNMSDREFIAWNVAKVVYGDDKNERK